MGKKYLLHIVTTGGLNHSVIAKLCTNECAALVTALIENSTIAHYELIAIPDIRDTDFSGVMDFAAGAWVG